MSVHLEYWLTGFFYLYCGYNHSLDGHIKKTKFVESLENIDEYEMIGNGCENDKFNKILGILRDKFENFRKYPNQKQVVKIDEISVNLKPYFMDYIGLDLYNKEKYVISFEKIIKIYENVKEIHFINEYIFDDGMLNNLVQYLFKNPVNKLLQIKFLYYNYEQMVRDIFYDPSKLDKILLNRLKKMNWIIESKSNGNTSYEIKIFFDYDAVNKKKKQYGKRNKKKRAEKNGYTNESTSIKVPRSVTNTLITGIKHKIPTHDDDEIMENDNEYSAAYIYSFMMKVSSLHNDNQVSDRSGKPIEIFNYGFRDINTDEILYFVAKPVLNPSKERNFKWKLFEKIYNSRDIESEFGISKHELPMLWKLRPCFTKQLCRKIIVINLIKDKRYIQELINKTAWHKKAEMPIYNKHENRKRITYSIEKKDFINQLIEFVTNNNNDVNITPVLIRNKNDSGHHVEFIQIISIKYKKEKCDIALSYEYQYERKHSIKIVGIYLDKCFIISQHQLISDCRECKCFDNFRSNIDYLTIGNPDYFANNMNKYKNENHKQREEIRRNKKLMKQVKAKRFHLTKVCTVTLHSIKTSNAINDDEKLQQNMRKKKSKKTNIIKQNKCNDKISKQLNTNASEFIPENNSNRLECIPEETKSEAAESIHSDDNVKHKSNVIPDECSNCVILQESLKIQTNINNFYFQQTLNLIPTAIQSHPAHQLPTTKAMLVPIITMPNSTALPDTHVPQPPICIPTNETLKETIERLKVENDRLVAERDLYKQLYMTTIKCTRKAIKTKSYERILTNQLQFKRKYDSYAVYAPTSAKRAQGNIKISKELTGEKIPTMIQETLFDVFSYIDKSTALQEDCYCNNGKIRIFNYGFHDKSGNELYCLARKHHKTINRGYEWQMENKLFTLDDIKSSFAIFKPQLPKSITTQRNYMVNMEHINEIKTIISKTNFMNSIKWNKLPVYSKRSNRRKYRTMLSLTVEEFRNKFVAKRNKNIVPIVLFEKDKFCVQYVCMGSIDFSTDVAISFMYNDKQGRVQPVGIHLDKQQMLVNHQLLYIHDTMNDLDDFESNYCDLQIGNVDENENIIKRLQKENDGFKEQLNILLESRHSDRVLML